MAYGLGYATGYSDALADNGIMPTVEILLETDPDTYVDIADDYREFSTMRGRNRELDRFQAGTCQIRLSDLGRDYDPSNTAGPHYGNLKPMRQLKVRAHWAGTAYDVFAGYVDSFEHEYAGPANGDATCTIYATDGFKVLEAAELQSSAYTQEVAADGPVHWWRLNEPADTNIVIDSVGGKHLTGFAGTPTFGAEGIVSREADTAMEIDHPEEGVYLRSATPVVSGNPCTVEAVLVVNDAVLGSGSLVFTNVYKGTTGFDDELVVRFDISNGKVEWAVWVGTVGTLAESTTTTVNNGDRIHIACTWDETGAMKTYRNGVDVTSGTPTRAPADFAPTFFDELVLGAVPPVGTAAFCGRYQMVAVYDQALPAARIAAHAEAVATPWDGDLPGERLERVLDAVEYPAAGRDLDTGTSTLQPAELNGMSALEHAQKVAESDFGVLFMTADGKVRFIGRAGLFNRPQQATFGDGGGAELGYRSLRPEYTDQLIRNDVAVSRLDGVAQRVEDAASIAEYLRHSYVIDGLFHDDDDLSKSAAEFIVAEYKEPQRRISNLIVTPRGDPDNLYPQVLGLELQDQITVIDRPPGGGDPNEQDSAIEGIAHTVTPMWWQTSWDVAPSFGSIGDPPAVGVWGETNWGESRWGF
jgi:hypothetical protein